MIAFIVLLLILLNGLFAMTEIALVSANRFRLEQRAESGNKGAQHVLALSSRSTWPTRPSRHWAASPR